MADQFWITSIGYWKCKYSLVLTRQHEWRLLSHFIAKQIVWCQYKVQTCMVDTCMCKPWDHPLSESTHIIFGMTGASTITLNSWSQNSPEDWQRWWLWRCLIDRNHGGVETSGAAWQKSKLHLYSGLPMFLSSELERMRVEFMLWEHSVLAVFWAD